MLLWRYVRNLGVNVHHPHDVCVGEGGVAFSAGERGPVFTTASIHVVPPHDFKYVSSRSVWCVGM